jgi:hypothetical protein
MSEAVLSLEQPATQRVPFQVTDLLAAALFLTLGVGLVLQPFVIRHEMPGDLADGRFNFSLLEFFYRALVSTLHGGPANFIDAPFFYPWPRVTNFSETHWGDGEVYALFRAVGVGPLASFRAWFIAGFVLTYLAAFVSLRQLGLHTWGAAAGAFLFTFPLPMAGQFGHAQLVYRLWVPPAIVAFDRFLTGRRLRAGAACVLFVALQLAASIYLGLFLCLLLVSYGMALCLFAPNRLAPPRWGTFRSAGAAELIGAGALLSIALVVLAVVAVPYFQVQSLYEFRRSWDEIADQLPRLGSYLLAAPSKLWPSLEATFPYPLVWEHKIFPGLSAIIPVVWFLFSNRARTRQPLAAPMLAAVTILFVITIDLGGYTLYRLIYLIPGFSAIRAVTRIMLVMMLPLAALFGMLIDDLTTARAYRFPHCLLAVVLAVFLVAECSLITVPASLASDWQARFDAIKARLPKKLPHDAVLVIGPEARRPGVDWPLLPDTDAESAAVVLGISTMNGYSGNNPPGWKVMTTCRDVWDNLQAGRHFLVENGLPAPDLRSDRLVLLDFGACDPTEFARGPVLEFDHTYAFAQGADGNQFPTEGFSQAESWGRWTDGEKASLFFRLDTTPPAAVSINFEAVSLSPAADGEQVVAVVANGQACGRLIVSVSRPNDKVTCAPGALRVGDNVLILHIEHPTRPIDLGLNADGRHLGLGLKTMTLATK